MRRFIGLAMLLAGCCLGGLAVAGKAEVRKQTELSTLVTGWVVIEKDGGVGGHTVDQPDKLPPAVRQLVDQAVAQWRFDPVTVDDRAVRARSRMGVHVVARQQENGNYQLRIGGTSFGEEVDEAGEPRRKKVAGSRQKLTPPRYPEAAYRANVAGTVFVLLKVDARGDVEDVAAEQVNLTVLGNEKQMEKARKLLSDATVRGAREWRFDAPDPEALGDDGYQVVRVPVDFSLSDRKLAYGQWRAYIPGPRQHPTWADDAADDQDPEAMIAGTAYPVGSGPRLRTPVSG